MEQEEEEVNPFSRMYSLIKGPSSLGWFASSWWSPVLTAVATTTSQAK